jgi:hypothetical protein
MTGLTDVSPERRRSTNFKLRLVTLLPTPRAVDAGMSVFVFRPFAAKRRRGLIDGTVFVDVDEITMRCARDGLPTNGSCTSPNPL